MRRREVAKEVADEFSAAAELGIDVSEWGVPATRETLVRLTPDPILRLAEGLGAAEVTAAFEIRGVYRKLTADVGYVCGRLDGMPRAGWRPRSGARIRGLGRYNRWVDAMTERRWSVGPVLDVVAEGMGIRETEKRRRIRHGRLVGAIGEALGLYAKEAGWV